MKLMTLGGRDYPPPSASQRSRYEQSFLPAAKCIINGASDGMHEPLGVDIEIRRSWEDLHP